MLERRTPLRSTKGLKRGGRLKRATALKPGQALARVPIRSKRRRGRARPDEPLQAWCEIAHPGVCTGRAEVRHHILMISQGGTDEASNTVDSCDADHKYIHDHPEWAYAHGWLRHSGPV